MSQPYVDPDCYASWLFPLLLALPSSLFFQYRRQSSFKTVRSDHGPQLQKANQGIPLSLSIKASILTGAIRADLRSRSYLPDPHLYYFSRLSRHYCHMN